MSTGALNLIMLPLFENQPTSTTEVIHIYGIFTSSSEYLSTNLDLGLMVYGHTVLYIIFIYGYSSVKLNSNSYTWPPHLNMFR